MTWPSTVVTFGVVADCQYARPGTGPAHPRRQYAESGWKLREAVEAFNRHDVAFVVSVGDLIDRSSADLPVVLEILSSCRAPVLHTLGNHDLQAFDGDRPAAVTGLGMAGPYYGITMHGLRLIVLDTNRCGVLDVPQKSKAWQDGVAHLAQRHAAGQVNARPWNGGVDDEQVGWLEDELAAPAAGTPVIVFGHQPLHPPNAHSVLNRDQVLDVLQASRNVAGYFNGHDHAGGLEIRAGRPYLTITGMVETMDNAFAVVEVHQRHFEVIGYGREPCRRLLSSPLAGASATRRPDFRR